MLPVPALPQLSRTAGLILVSQDLLIYLKSRVAHGDYIAT